MKDDTDNSQLIKFGTRQTSITILVSLIVSIIGGFALYKIHNRNQSKVNTVQANRTSITIKANKTKEQASQVNSYQEHISFPIKN